jgi:hypothetical protein
MASVHGQSPGSVVGRGEKNLRCIVDAQLQACRGDIVYVHRVTRANASRPNRCATLADVLLVLADTQAHDPLIERAHRIVMNSERGWPTCRHQ